MLQIDLGAKPATVPDGPDPMPLKEMQLELNTNIGRCGMERTCYFFNSYTFFLGRQVSVP